MNNKSIIINYIVIITVSITVAFISGCDSTDLLSAQPNQAPNSVISIDQVQDILDEFEEVFTSKIKVTSDEIDRLSGDPKVKKMTLLWRSRAIAALHNLNEQQQPTIAMVDNWLLCIRIANFIEYGEAGNTFGDYRTIALDTAKELETQIEGIAQRVLKKELFDKTSAELKRLASANPIQSGFSKTLMYSSQTKTTEPGLVESLVAIPLSPVRALEGVDRTPTAIHEFSNTTRQMADIIQELPESARWQLLLLMYDLEETNMANSFLQSLQNISDSSNKLSETADKIVVMLDDSDQNQDQIRQTLLQVDKTSSNLKELLSSFSQSAETFTQTVQTVDKAAASWTQATESTKRLIGELKPAPGADNKTEKMDIKETADAVRMAANEINLLTAKLPEDTEQLVAQMSLLTRQITKSIAFLIILLFSLSIVYMIVRKKINK